MVSVPAYLLENPLPVLHFAVSPDAAGDGSQARRKCGHPEQDVEDNENLPWHDRQHGSAPSPCSYLTTQTCTVMDQYNIFFDPIYTHPDFCAVDGNVAVADGTA